MQKLWMLTFTLVTFLYISSKIYKYQKRKFLSKNEFVGLFSNENINLTKILDSIDLNDISASTSAKSTYVEFDENARYKFGDEFHAKIIAENYRNQLKTYGGDFFRAVLRPKYATEDGVAAKIIDHSNGTYSIRAPLLWKGPTLLIILLVHSSEAVQALKIKTSVFGFGFSSNEIKLPGKKETQRVDCYAHFYERTHVCNFSNPIYGERWYCDRPLSGCDAITMYGRDLDLPKSKLLETQWVEEYLPNSKVLVEITGSGKSFNVENSEEFRLKQIRLPPCEITRSEIYKENSKITGFFWGGKWMSTICRNVQFSSQEILSCLKNTQLVVIGDSTARQFYTLFKNIVGEAEVQEDILDSAYFYTPRAFVSHNHSIECRYIVHGPPLVNYGPFRIKQYMSVSMDKIKPLPGKQTVVFLAFGLHFTTFRVSYFRKRVLIVRKAILNLVDRLPNVKIVVKGLNLHYTDYIYRTSQWLCFRLNVILNEGLGGLKNVAIINTWDMTTVQIATDIHPERPMIEHQFGLALSHICSI